jgi:hypothetical protein
MRQGPYSPNDDDTVLRLVSEGMTNQAIGEIIGRTEKSVCARLSKIRPAGMERRGSYHRYTPDEDAQIVTLRNANHRFIDIGIGLGLTGGQVRERYFLLCNGSDYKAQQNTLEGFEARDDDYVEACIAEGGFIHREVIDGCVFTFDWRGMVSHERRAA